MNIKILKPEIKRQFLDGKSVIEIRKFFPKVSNSTIYSWVKREKWETLRDEKIKKYTDSPEILLDMLNQLMQEIPDILKKEEMTTSDKAAATVKISDSISKVCKSIKTLSKDKDRLSQIIFTISELGKFMNECDFKHSLDADFRAKLDRLLSGFQSKMIEKYSPINMNN